MRSHTTPTAHLPTELLSEILMEVHGDTKTLRNVSLSCRHFRSLAQALIFRSVNLICSERNNLSRQSARLDFYSSDAIAPFVHQLLMSSFTEEEETILVPKILEALPRFTNIRWLTCFCVDFAQLKFAQRQMSALPLLQNLITVNCSAPPKSDSSPILRPRVFAFIVNDMEEGQLEVQHWLPLLDPDHLQVLHIPLTHDACSFFLANDNPSICPFPSLWGAELDVDEETLPILPMIFSKTPALRRLKLCLDLDVELCIRIVEGLVSPTVCPIPHLEEYGGAHKLLPIVLGQAKGSSSALVTRLALENVDQAGDPLIAFMDSLKSCDPLQLKALTHLHISLLKSMDLKALAELRDMFPVLQELYLHAVEESRPSAHVQDIDLNDLNTLPLPNTLVSLSIQWTSDWNAEVLNLTAAKDNLLPRLPHLRRLWLLDLSKLALLWSRTGSRSEERCTLHEIKLKAEVWDHSLPSQHDAWAMRQAVFPEQSIIRL